MSSFLTGQKVYVPDTAELDDRPVFRGMADKLGVRSYVELPLFIRGKFIGSLILYSTRRNAYDDLDMGFAMEIASAVAIALDNCIAYERITRSRAQLDAENQLLRSELRAAEPGRMVAESAAMREVMRLVELVAPTDATVLINGETGVGKERLAQLIHERSERAERPMLAINCAAIPTSLIESELFGHEAGASTGARPGADAAGSSSPTAARCCSTRSASSRSMPRPSCCAYCRRKSSSASAVARRSPSTCA